MAQYVYCKGHKPGCQGYRLAEILSIFVYASGETRKGAGGQQHMLLPGSIPGCFFYKTARSGAKTT
jgi:hypothetical protein